MEMLYMYVAFYCVDCERYNVEKIYFMINKVYFMNSVA